MPFSCSPRIAGGCLATAIRHYKPRTTPGNRKRMRTKTPRPPGSPAGLPAARCLPSEALAKEGHPESRRIRDESRLALRGGRGRERAWRSASADLSCSLSAVSVVIGRYRR